MTISPTRYVRLVMTGLVLLYLMTPVGVSSEEKASPSSSQSSVATEQDMGKKVQTYTSPVEIPKRPSDVGPFSDHAMVLMFAAIALTLISCTLIIFIIGRVLPKTEERLKHRIAQTELETTEQVRRGIALMRVQLSVIDPANFEKTLRVTLEKAGLQGPDMLKMIPERLMGLEIQLANINEQCAELLNQVNRQIQDQRTKIEGQTKEIQGIRSQLESLNETLNKEPQEARHWMRSYYPTLVDKALRDKARAANTHAENPLPQKLETMRSHLLALRDTISGPAAQLTESYIREIDDALGTKNDANKLKEEINGLIASWDQKQYLKAQLERDTMYLLDPSRSVDFISESLMSHDAKRAIREGMDRKIRELIWQGLVNLGNSSSKAPYDLIRTFVAKIVDLIQGIDRQLSDSTEEFFEADKHVKGILDCLGLEVLPVELNREEFDDRKHFKLRSDPESRYPPNTVVKVIRRGLRHKTDGEIHTKAQVAVAQKSS